MLVVLTKTSCFGATDYGRFEDGIDQIVELAVQNPSWKLLAIHSAEGVASIEKLSSLVTSSFLSDILQCLGTNIKTRHSNPRLKRYFHHTEYCLNTRLRANQKYRGLMLKFNLPPIMVQ
jgi:hypothetical protein